MRVHFLVPGSIERPGGGLRIILEHAKRLAERGVEVEIVQIFRLPFTPFRRQVRDFLAWMKQVATGPVSPDWFDLGREAKRSYRFFRRLPAFGPNDKIVSTYFPTHEILGHRLDRHDCFAFIQGYETFTVDAEVLHRHWRSPSRNIVVSRWLQQLVIEQSGQADLVPNAIDQEFFCDLGLRSRSQVPTILFISMPRPAKGTRDVIAALNALHGKGQAFRVLSFGAVHPREQGLEPDCDYVPSPSQETIRDLYNAADIFVSASHSEGWGLPLAEATSCGAAVIASNIPGHREFLAPERDALFFDCGDTAGLEAQLARLMTDQRLQAALKTRAKAALAPYTWERATNAMMTALGIGGGG